MKAWMFLIIVLSYQTAFAGDNGIQLLLNQYRHDGAGVFDASKGRSMWEKQYFQKKLGRPVSCATCHTSDIRQAGEHIRTGKVIQAMTASNPDRFQDSKKIEKWFKRNCKWTWGRECSVQEKGDFLAFFQSQ